MTKRWTQVLLWAGVLLTAAMIFAFSSQDGEASAALSQQIVKPMVELAARLQPGMTAEALQELTQTLHQAVRKAAHMTEFALLGFFLLLLAHSYGQRRKKLIAWCAGTFYAVTDEIHQRFITARGPDLADVAIDSIGAVMGIGLASLVIWAVRRRRSKTNKGV